MGDFSLKSPAFKEGETIPRKHACEGDDVNPMLEIRNAPEGVRSFAIVVDDPDATRGVPWNHWILWNIDPKTQYIAEDTVPHGAALGKTSFGTMKYGGPCPPRGSKPHRYFFKLYALDTAFTLAEGATKQELEAAMKDHILADTHLMGMYGRQ